jgi:hypothetical protein
MTIGVKDERNVRKHKAKPAQHTAKVSIKPSSAEHVVAGWNYCQSQDPETPVGRPGSARSDSQSHAVRNGPGRRLHGANFTRVVNSHVVVLEFEHFHERKGVGSASRFRSSTSLVTLPVTFPSFT